MPYGDRLTQTEQIEWLHMHMGCTEYFITPECKQSDLSTSEIDLSPSEIDLSPNEIDSPPYKQWLSLALKRAIQWFTKIYIAN